MLAIALATTIAALGPYDDETASIRVRGASFASISCNSSFATDAIYTDGWRFLNMKVRLARSAATAVTMVCAHGEDANSTVYKIPVETYSGSTANAAQKVWRWPTTTSDSWSWTIDLWGYRYTSCAFTCTAGNSNDRLTVTGIVGVGQ